MKTLKQFFVVILVGSFVGAIFFAWFSPYLIVWYFTPPADFGISCKSAVQWSIDTYRKVLFTGLLLGAIVSAIFYLAFFRRKKVPAMDSSNLGP